MLNLRSQTRRFSAAIVPVVLVVAFAVTKIAIHTTSRHLTGSAGLSGEVWIDYLGTALYVGFAAIIAANTLAMITIERRRDIALLRLAGTTPGQVIRMIAWEASLVALTALVLGGVIALTTLAPLLHGQFHTTWPYLPWSAAVGIGGAVWLLALAPTVIPVLANRHPAAETAKAT
jgi:putative ABC transport system permease protein